MTQISPTTGYLLLALFTAAMIGLTYLFARREKRKTVEGFLVARRQVPWWTGGPSIAISWIWAGALFVSIQVTYQQGLAGIFWFTFPNVLALAVYALLGPRIRARFSRGYTLPQFVRERLGSKRVHRIFLVPFFFGQLVAVTFNIVAGSTMISAITGISPSVLLPLLAFLPLLYTLISGLEASIVTDFLQLVLLLLAIVIIVPWAVSAAGGWAPVAAGAGGVTGKFGNPLDPTVAFELGVVTSIGLISQTITDQMYWQRSFALREKHIAKAFLFGALLFGLVPLSLSLLGFVAAVPATGVELPPGTDPALIGVRTVAHLLPPWALGLFVVALLSGLCSTVDGAQSATSSLWATDVARYTDAERRLLERQSKREPLSAEEAAQAAVLQARVIRTSRFAMLAITVAGLLLAYATHLVAGFGLKQLFLLSISMAACTSVPTVLSLYSDRLSADGVFWGVLSAIVIGMPLFFYADHLGHSVWIAAASILMVGLSAGFCLGWPTKQPARPAAAAAAGGNDGASR